MILLMKLGASPAAVLSFSALCDLATLCGFSELDCAVATDRARRRLRGWHAALADRSNGMGFGRVLALTLLTISVLGNSIGLYLVSYHLAPGWAVVVATSALAPAILGGVTQLAVGVGDPSPRSWAADRAPYPLEEGARFEDGTDLSEG